MLQARIQLAQDRVSWRSFESKEPSGSIKVGEFLGRPVKLESAPWS
jgi:hypothetical protein